MEYVFCSAFVKSRIEQMQDSDIERGQHGEIVRLSLIGLEKDLCHFVYAKALISVRKMHVQVSVFQWLLIKL